MSNRRDDANAFVKALNGRPTYLGTITATTAKDNSNTAVPFSIVAGSLLMVQPDTACYILPQTVAATAVTTANGVKLVADERFYIMEGSADAYLSCLAVSGTTVLKVWKLD